VSKVPFIDFTKAKEQISPEQVIQHTNLPFVKKGNQFRCACPVHHGGDRSLVVTPSEVAFYCHAAQEGGDHLGLLAHIRQSKPYGAVKELCETFAPHLLPGAVSKPALPPTIPDTVPKKPIAVQKETATTSPSSETVEKEKGSGAERGFSPLPYLMPEHPAVQALGISPDVARALGLGYAPRGHHRGCVAIPVRNDDGRLAGYIGFDGTTIRLPPKWIL
jgi:hypothetical protein